jgi:hypothetical protein
VLAAALALIVAGVLIGLFLGVYVYGFIVAAVGLVLLVLVLVGFGRRSAEGRP